MSIGTDILINNINIDFISKNKGEVSNFGPVLRVSSGALQDSRIFHVFFEIFTINIREPLIPLTENRFFTKRIVWKVFSKIDCT